jgi:uncharacterized protein (TIGR03067 family)
MEEIYMVPELEGEWSMLSGTLGGQDLPAEFVGAAVRIGAGDEVTILFGGQIFARSKVKIDRSVKPAAVEYHNLEGSYAGKTQYGICELAGDTIRICLAPPGSASAKDFTSTPENDHTLLVWQRRPRA